MSSKQRKMKEEENDLSTQGIMKRSETLDLTIVFPHMWHCVEYTVNVCTIMDGWIQKWISYAPSHRDKVSRGFSDLNAVLGSKIRD